MKKFRKQEQRTPLINKAYAAFCASGQKIYHALIYLFVYADHQCAHCRLDHSVGKCDSSYLNGAEKFFVLHFVSFFLW